MKLDKTSREYWHKHYCTVYDPFISQGPQDWAVEARKEKEYQKWLRKIKKEEKK
jgi:hypothetical protein